MVTDDGKAWQRLAQLALHDFTVAPSQPNVVLGGGEGGLVRSNDGGTAFAPVPSAPQLVFVDWSAGGLYGLDTAGVVWASADGGTTWERTGELGSPPGALTVTETGQLFAADDEGVVTSRDGGHTFTPVVRYSPTTHG